MRIREPPSGHGVPQCTIKVPGAGANNLRRANPWRRHPASRNPGANLRNSQKFSPSTAICKALPPKKSKKRGGTRGIHPLFRSRQATAFRHPARGICGNPAAKREEPGHKSTLSHRAASATLPPHVRRKRPLMPRPQASPPITPISDDAAHRGPGAGKSGRASRPGARSAALPSGAICRRRDRRIPARRRPYAHRAPSCGRGRAPDTCGDQIPPVCRGRPCGCRQSWPGASRSRC